MKNVIAVIIVLVVVVGGYLLVTHKATAPTNGEAQPLQNTSPAPTGTQPSAAGATTVTYTDSGFNPSTVTVKVGSTVTFMNQSSHEMWVAVGNHPTHTTYDGTSVQQHCPSTGATFDECQAVGSGASWSFTFTKAGSWTFHNHKLASDGGSITVSP